MRIVVAALLWSVVHRRRLGACALARAGCGRDYELYFGEFDENLREGSPGLLDRFEAAARRQGVRRLGRRGAEGREEADIAFSCAACPPAPVQRRGRAGARHRAQAGRQGHAHPGPARRRATSADFSERQPVIPLDIVPTGKPGRVQGLLRRQAAAQRQGRGRDRVRLEARVQDRRWRRLRRSSCRGRAPTQSKCRWSTPRRAFTAPRPMTACAS